MLAVPLNIEQPPRNPPNSTPRNTRVRDKPIINLNNEVLLSQSCKIVPWTLVYRLSSHKSPTAQWKNIWTSNYSVEGHMCLRVQLLFEIFHCYSESHPRFLSHNLLKKPFQPPTPLPCFNFLASFKMDFSQLSAEDTHIWGRGGGGGRVGGCLGGRVRIKMKWPLEERKFFSESTFSKWNNAFCLMFCPPRLAW